jgi:tRNA A37 methylthiotransferase MiaB
MNAIGNLICLSPRDSYLVDEPIGSKGVLARLEKRAGLFFRSPGVGYPYLVGFFRKNGVIDDSTRVVVQHDLIEGPTSFENVLGTKVDPDRGDCDVLFVTAYTNSVREAYRRAREAKRAYKAIGRKLVVVLGGPHASAVPEEGTRFGHVDTVVAGEGEWAASELLNDLKAGRPIRPLYRAPFGRIRDENSLSLDMSIWKGLQPAPQQVLTSATFARGCKLDCSFCAVKLTNGELVRNRDCSDVVHEIKSQEIAFDRTTIAGAPAGSYNRFLKMFVHLPFIGKRYGDAMIRQIGPGHTNHFFFWDDNLFNARGAFRKLLEEIRPLQRPWAAQLTIDVAEHPDLLELAHDSGCRHLFLGIESVSQVGLNALDKWSNQTHSMNDAIKRIKDAGISVMGAFVFGLEGEDSSVFDRTLEFVYRTGIDYIVANIIQPYPGTGTFLDAVAAGDLLPATACPAGSDVAMDYNWPLFDGAHVLVQPKGMSAEELQNGYFYFLKEAYSLRGISRRFRWQETSPVHYPWHFTRNWLLSRYTMNKTAFALRQSPVKPVIRPQDTTEEVVLPAGIPESS